MELCTQEGRTLKAFSLTECRGGPHEFRGIRRSELLQGLRQALPSDLLHYGCPIRDVTPDPNGAITPSTCIFVAVPQLPASYLQGQALAHSALEKDLNPDNKHGDPAARVHHSCSCWSAARLILLALNFCTNDMDT